MEKKMGILVTSLGCFLVFGLSLGILLGTRPSLTTAEETSSESQVSETTSESEDSQTNYISYEDESITPSESSSEKETEEEQSSESEQDSSSESEEEPDESSSEDVVDPEPEEKEEPEPVVVYDSIDDILAEGQNYSSKTLLGHYKIMGYVVKKDATNVIVAAEKEVENPVDVTTSLWVEVNPEGYEVGDEVVFEGDVYAKARQNLRGTRTCTKMYAEVEEN